MKVTPTLLPEVLEIEPDLFGDARGYFLETFSEQRYREAGINCRFVQDNHSFSRAGVLRGLHFQVGREQAKLIFVLHGSIFDVAVDVRRGSPTFGRWAGTVLSGEKKNQLFIPTGFAHGFFVLEDADVVYKCSDYYSREDERGVIWNDPTLAVAWPEGVPLLSPRDLALPRLSELGDEDLPRFG